MFHGISFESIAYSGIYSFDRWSDSVLKTFLEAVTRHLLLWPLCFALSTLWRPSYPPLSWKSCICWRFKPEPAIFCTIAFDNTFFDIMSLKEGKLVVILAWCWRDSQTNSTRKLCEERTDFWVSDEEVDLLRISHPQGHYEHHMFCLGSPSPVLLVCRNFCWAIISLT